MAAGYGAGAGRPRRAAAGLAFQTEAELFQAFEAARSPFPSLAPSLAPPSALQGAAAPGAPRPGLSGLHGRPGLLLGGVSARRDTCMPGEHEALSRTWMPSFQPLPAPANAAGVLLLYPLHGSLYCCLREVNEPKWALVPTDFCKTLETSTLSPHATETGSPRWQRPGLFLQGINGSGIIIAYMKRPGVGTQVMQEQPWTCETLILTYLAKSNSVSSRLSWPDIGVTQGSFKDSC